MHTIYVQQKIFKWKVVVVVATQQGVCPSSLYLCNSWLVQIQEASNQVWTSQELHKYKLDGHTPCCVATTTTTFHLKIFCWT